MHQLLKKERLKMGYTSKFMAEKLDISIPFYSQIETGKRKITYKLAVKIADIFNLKPDDLFYEELRR